MCPLNDTVWKYHREAGRQALVEELGYLVRRIASSEEARWGILVEITQPTSGPSGPLNIENHVHRLLNLNLTLAFFRTDRPHVDRHALPRRIKQLVPIK